MMFFKRNRYNKLIDILKSTIAGLEEKLRRLENENSQMQAILSSMAEGVIAVDKDTRIRSVNPTIEKVFNISANEVKGKFFLEAIRNNDLSELINNVLDRGEFISKELTLIWPVQKIFQINASPIFEKDAVSGCLLVMHDVTEIRRLETMRRDFVANVSHELRTPLTSIKGFVETLLEGALDDKENLFHFLKIIQAHSERLHNLINDLLDLSHIESKEMPLEKGEFDLKGLIKETLLGFRSQLKKKSIQVRDDLPVKILVRANQDKIEQVLTNLIDNAIKFNREKGSINFFCLDSDDNVKIVIEDSGIGIPPKDLPRIFERFYRVDKARSRELGGTGLGLSIVKHIVELHGGSVGVESIEGSGSKFWFTLPK